MYRRLRGTRGGAYSTAEGNDQLESALKTATDHCSLAAQPAIVAANYIMSLMFFMGCGFTSGGQKSGVCV